MPRHAGSRSGSARSSSLARAMLVIALVTVSHASRAQGLDPSDWPCPQVLVRQISLPAVWSGPPIDGVTWRGDPARVERIARLAARRNSIEDAQRTIEDVATAAGPRKTPELLALFAGLFETLDAERTQVIDGLVRFGRKQRDLAEAIKAEQAALRGTAEPRGDAPDPESAVTRLNWNLRVFEERRQALASACESPALIEQRLFALARIIQQSFD